LSQQRWLILSYLESFVGSTDDGRESQFYTAVSCEASGEWPSQFRGDRLLNLNKQGIVVRFAKKTLWTVLASPFFLLAVLSTILFIPRRLFQALNVRASERGGFFSRAGKRLLDLAGSTFALVASSLVWLILPIIIRLESRGEAVFQQERVGLNRRRDDRRKVGLVVPYDRRNGDRRKLDRHGRPFILYKFRSMVHDAEKKVGPVWASNNDPRVTRVGKIMRQLHLDEIPQVINVIRGEMSLVGPRPERPEFIEKLREEIPDYNKRLQGKPGITGLAQVSTGYDSSVEDVKKKLNYDLSYLQRIRGGKVLMDLKIIYWTLCKIVTNRTREQAEQNNGLPEQRNGLPEQQRNGLNGAQSTPKNGYEQKQYLRVG
jgi:lipopolysaccharide/colanic/teichoic acid biosynthesis glycosyltransferase